jgi:hypothetical protein
LPKPVVPEKLSDSGSCADHRNEERRIAPILQKRFHPRVQKSTVEVGFGCDPVTFDVEEIIVETGSGHGGSLTLWWIRRPNSDSDFEVTQFEHGSYYSKAKPEREGKIARGRLSAAAATKAFRTALPALTATFREIEPPRLPNSIHGFSVSSSSHDFHAAISVTDGGRRLARRFTGYEGSSGQERYLGVQLALETLSPVLDQVKPVEANISDEERGFFVKHVSSIAPTFYDQFAWWVRERYLVLVARYGATELGHLLVEELRHGLAEVEKLPDAERVDMSVRYLGDPINGLVRLTGFDPRLGGDGKPRPLVEVAKELVEECSP